MIVETRLRAGAKTIGWRVLAASAMGLFAYFISGGSEVTASGLAVSIFAFDLVAKTIGLYAWERLWARVVWGRRMANYPGCCVWLTGLPASGKTTISKALEQRLRDRLIPVYRLDGDVVRQLFCTDLGFSKEDRDENIHRNSLVASYISHSGRVAIASFVSPYSDARMKARNITKNFIEVLVKCPLEECERRDAEDPQRPGLYAKARAGLIKGFTGIDDPYEEPKNCELVLETDKLNVEECVDLIVKTLKERGLLSVI